MELGLQLYSLRDVIGDDVDGTIRKVAEMGYKTVEFAGYYGKSAAEMKKLLDDCGLRAVSTHISLELITEHFDEQLEYNLAVGNRNLILPWGGMKNGDDCKRIGEILNVAAQKAAKYGAFVGYHNHAYEFEGVENGERFIDILARETDPSVTFEFDVYWVSFGGASPEEYIKKYADRQRVMHLKELSRDEPKRNVEIGDGCIDFAGIIKLGKQVGVRDFIVEQEAYTMPQLDSCSRSFKGVEKLGVL